MFGLDFIKKLKPAEYNYKQIDYFGSSFDTQKKYLGFVAQDVKELLDTEDYAVVKKDKNGYYMIDYYQFIAPMVKAIQELSDKVEGLEKKVNEK